MFILRAGAVAHAWDVSMLGEDVRFKTSLHYVVRLCLKTEKNKFLWVSS